MMIGQDRVLATPLHMASVAAAAPTGRGARPACCRATRLAHGPHAPKSALRLMRAVVTDGTGPRGRRGGAAGKRGTAEFGTGDPPPTHAWFIGYRGGFAVLLVEGGRAGRVAAPIAARFLARLPTG